ncbi:MAG: hypothetical protein ACK4MF_07700 [Hyphomicrobiaceae bacterium]
MPIWKDNAMPIARYDVFRVPRIAGATVARLKQADPLAWTLTTLAAPLAVAALYLVKSALGINLLPGPSPLHALLYHFVV